MDTGDPESKVKVTSFPSTWASTVRDDAPTARTCTSDTTLPLTVLSKMVQVVALVTLGIKGGTRLIPLNVPHTPTTPAPAAGARRLLSPGLWLLPPLLPPFLLRRTWRMAPTTTTLLLTSFLAVAATGAPPGKARVQLGSPLPSPPAQLTPVSLRASGTW